MGLTKAWNRFKRQSVRGLGLGHLVAIEEVARCQNRFVYKPHVKWWADRAWTEPYRAFLQQDASSKKGTDETRNLDRRFGLAEFSRAVRHLPGSTAECGVLRGVGSGIICQTLKDTYKDGACHLAFDSFEGLPAPTTEDLDAAGKT